MIIILKKLSVEILIKEKLLGLGYHFCFMYSVRTSQLQRNFYFKIAHFKNAAHFTGGSGKIIIRAKNFALLVIECTFKKQAVHGLNVNCLYFISAKQVSISILKKNMVHTSTS